MIESIEHQGILIDELTTPGDRRQDRVAPNQANGIQLSRDRFLLLISTLAFRGLDDSRSILYQIRQGSYAGPVLREGMLAQSIDDWKPLGDGKPYVRQFGHPVGFGVPKGAVIDGRPAPHANVFAVAWRVVARELAPEGHLLWFSESPELSPRTQSVEWMQFKLNEAGDDLEILQPAQQLRQVGYEAGPQFCEHDVANMNQTFAQPVAYTRDGMEWAGVNHFDFRDVREGRTHDADQSYAGPYIAPLRYRFNVKRGLYEWVQTGAALRRGLFEASLTRHGEEWIVAGRRRDGGGPAWGRTGDVFEQPCAMRDMAQTVAPRCPLTLYTRPDGALMLLSGDRETSPHGAGRNPLYCWQVDPDRDFALHEKRVVFDTFEAGLPIAKDHGPIVDMAKLLPHTGGREQTLIHRVRSVGMIKADVDYGGPAKVQTEGDFRATGVYHATVRYDRDFAPAWAFNDGAPS